MPDVLILGGSSGLGRHLTLEAMRRGCNVIVAGPSVNKLPPGDPLEGAGKIELDLLTVFDPRADHMAEMDFAIAAAHCDILLWVSGIWEREPFPSNDWERVERLITLHLRAPIKLLHEAWKMRVENLRPLHLVTVCSSSAKKIRADGQTIYGMVQAGKAKFAQNLHAEGTVGKSTIVYPGGMKTDLFKGRVDTTPFADPAEVAAAIWSRVHRVGPDAIEMDVFQKDGRLVVDCTPHDPLCP